MTRIIHEWTRSDQKVIEPVDTQVGDRIKRQRKLMGMSQTVLAARLGITFQQVQKYEKGANRVSASRLQAVADILGVPVGYFFAGDDAEVDHRSGENEVDATAAAQHAITAFVRSANGRTLNEAFAKIGSAKTRSNLIKLIETLGSPNT